VGFLADDEPVLALAVAGEARAYPVQVLIWHEIVNDTLAGIPTAVTYCPLCNSAVAYDRRLGDRVLEFGTSGMLYNSALVMYDRQTESLWSHFTGEAVIGHLTGAPLEIYPMATVSWADWHDAHPNGLVLSRDTSFDRDYGRNPYPGYDDVDSSPFLFEGEVDGRLAAMERIVAIERDGEAVAVRLDELDDAGVLEVEVGDTTLVAWVEPGTASALDAGSVSAGRDVGATGVFEPIADGRRLGFQRDDDGSSTTRRVAAGASWGKPSRARSRGRHSCRWRISTRSGSPGRPTNPTPRSCRDPASRGESRYLRASFQPRRIRRSTTGNAACSTHTNSRPRSLGRGWNRNVMPSRDRAGASRPTDQLPRIVWSG
jgi:Protein of unknown function (DUF3179)